MALKDKAVKWYLKNIEMPKREVQDHPGFMGENMGSDNIFLRDVALPEQVLIEIERRIDEPEILYGIGKKFGYRYASNSGFKQYADVSEKKFKEEVYLFVRYVESVSYGRDFDYDLDYDAKSIMLYLHDYIVCSTTGGGYVFPTGGSAGIWSFLLDNPRTEAVQLTCQGKGDDKCSVLCSPPAVLEEEHPDYFQYEIEFNDLSLSRDYSQLNRIQETDFAENSFKDFKEIGFFEYRDGLFYHDDERYLWSEASLIYLLGSDLGPEHSSELFDAAFQYGRSLAEKESDRTMEKFITEYLSACGWGDTHITENNGGFTVHGYLFPWTRFYEETTFPIYRGLVSGLLSGFSDREVRLTEVEKNLKGDGFTVTVSEE